MSQESKVYAPDRDAGQRMLGSVGFSVLTHASLLAFLLFSQTNAKPHLNEPRDGGSVSLTESTDNLAASPAGTAGKNGGEEAANKATEQTLLAKEDDPTGVEVVSAPVPVAVVPPVQKPVQKPVPKPEPKPIIKVAKLPHSHKAPAKPAAIVKTPKEIPTEAYQPESIQDAAPIVESPPPEELSPVIGEAPAQPRSDETAEPVAAEKPVPPVAAPIEVAAAETPKNEPEPEAIPKRTAETIREPIQERSQEPSTGAAAGSAPEAIPKAAAIIAGSAGNGKGDQDGEQAADAGPTGPIVDASVRKPLAGNPLPSYPAQDRLQHHEGTTVLVGKVATDGRLSNIEIEKSSGSTAMDKASLEAFKKWRFAPGAEAWVRKTISFNLNGDTQTMPAKLGSR